MNKKQAGIIVTLLALIICAGILAAKVNGPLAVADKSFDSSSGVLSFSKGDTTADKASTTSDYFNSTRLQKKQNDDTTLANLKAMVDDKSVSQASKKEAIDKYAKLSTDVNNEQRIEEILKGKGFEDAICFIEDNKVRVIIKAKELSSQDRKKIQDVVYSVAKMEVEVELKQ